MMEELPVASDSALIEAAARIWNALESEDWLEAFAAHPRIGDVSSLRRRFADTESWARSEQSGVQDATDSTLVELAEGNAAYEAKFGYIFIVCATGKTAGEMLSLLQSRILSSPSDELPIAAGEQLKITMLRLRKLGE